MQEPQQIQSGIGSLQDPRQGYFLGKLVKKAGRAVKKVFKSPLGKMAIMGGLSMIPFGGFGAAAGTKASLFSRLGGALGTGGKLSTLGDMFRVGGKEGAKFSMPRMLAGGLGATALAAPFFMGGDDEDDGPVDQMDPRYQVQRAKNFYSGAGDAGAGLDFMPQKKYVMQNFYAADGGRAGYANGMLVEDEEEEFIRSGAGQRKRMPQTFLNMGGGAGEAQAEQMLMMEYVKYKNKGGNLSFEQFVKAVMQAQQEQQMPEGAGMEQPEAVQMAANGGRIGYAGGQLVSPSGDGSRPGYAGPLDFFKNLKSGFDQIIGGETSAFLGGDQEKINEILTKKGYGIDLEPDVIEMIIDMNKKGIDIDTISSVTGTDSSSISNVIDMLNMNIEQKAYGGRIGKQEGGIMATDEASEMIDMGGMEKDFRNEGGFVAMGGKERADDVPARLSKNEFVFTADAVRNAGGGDIDKGAEVMENLMSNLEQGGEISEESQGLEGAQAMYDQQQMLQSRVV